MTLPISLRWLLGASLTAGALVLATPSASIADPPGMMREERWKSLSEVQFAELKAADDLFKNKKWTAARNAYEKFMTVYPKLEQAIYCQLMIGEVIRLSGKPNNAITEFQFVRDLAPESDDAKWAHLRIAQCYKAAGNVEKAWLAYGDIWDSYGDHPVAFWAAVDQVAILEGQGKMRDRHKHWGALVERFEKKRIDDREFHAALSGLAREKLFLADVEGAYELINKGAKAPSLVLHARAVELRRPGKSVEGPEAQLLAMARGVIIENKKRPDPKFPLDKVGQAVVAKAHGWLKEKKDRPGYQALIVDVCDILLSMEKSAEAIKFAQDARALYDDDPWTYELLCTIFQKLGQMDEAIKTAGQARKIHSDADWALDMYAGLVWLTKDYDNAIAVWDKMKDKEELYTTTSEKWLTIGRYDDAIARRRKLLDLGPEHPGPVHMWIGGALEKAKQYEKAIAEYHQARNEPTNLYAIAKCLSSQAKHKEAIAQYGEIAAAFTDTEAHNAIYMMAMEYERLNDKTTAINLMRRVCRTYPRTRGAAMSHERLESKYNIMETTGGSRGDTPQE